MNLLYITESDLDLYTALAVIFGIINLIIYWVLAYNVAQIKKNTKSDNNLRVQFAQRVQLNDLDGAYGILLLIFYNWMYSQETSWEDTYQAAVTKFGELFKKIGKEAPPAPLHYNM